ncbi:ABC transporter permease protein [Gottschalkia acidurici 9a]|uniref:ABC transporter permease protein n=1 Tax=Gottschalkia acidurici (strain ATCC 7906 / DSM 604 / BCRC 14475 / CIP 104303 / KCTC 5404 / NCIMB 10678 / 9a) TaxID=1128398 RepID=K0B2H0_GOTA9|nr:FtsX-like permease family protein [Gottschalkia acidurici]AFS79694.1 ABC transporter permease protein [Gottschalkia acidurici 9a]
MLQNNNKTTIKELAKKTLKANKNRNIFAILAIILTTLLFTSIFTLGMNLIKSMELATMKQIGTSGHGGFEGLTEDEYEKLIKHPLVKDYGRSMFLAVATNDVFKSKAVEIRYADDKWAEFTFSTPIKGKLPQNKYEVAMPTWVLDMINVPHKLGSTVHLEYEINEIKYSKDFVLSGFWESDKNLSTAGMAYISRDFVEESIKGIDIETILTNYNDKGITALEIMLDNSWSIEQKLKKIADETGVTWDDRYGVNWAYTTTKIIDLRSVLTFGITLSLILLSGYLLIYNIFYISVVKDIRYFGLLKTIGATSKQLKYIIKKQAFSLSLIGIPIGLITGYFLGTKVTPFLMTGNFAKDSITFSSSPIIFIGSIIFTLITVLLSCKKPEKIVSKVSPVEAIKYTGVSTDIKRKSKSSTNGSKIYRMAFSNILRSKRKTITVIMSLSLSIIILNFVVTLISGFNMDIYLESYIRGDFVIGNSTYHTHYTVFDEQPTLTKEICDDIEKNNDVDRIDRVYFYNGQAKINEDEVRRLEEEKNTVEKEDKNKLTMINNVLESKLIYAQVYGLDQGWFDIYRDDHIIEGEFDSEKFKTGKYVLVDGKEKHYSVGDNITLSTLDGKEETFEVMAVVESLYVYDVKYSRSMTAKVYMPSSSFTEFIENPVIMSAQVYAKDGRVESLENYMKTIVSSTPDLEYIPKSNYVDEYKGFVNSFSTVGLSLSLIIGVIGVINFINTMLTSIISRKHEFALLQTVGMTKKQLRKMIIYEGLYYGAMTVFIVLTIGTIIVQSAVKSVGSPMPHFIYTFKIIPTLISSIMIMIISFILPIICYTSIDKSSMIERLREAE